jgi:ethanolamine ammonia-lyase small subunit
MTTASDPLVTATPWQSLRRFTAARIALGRAGISVPTVEQLDFRLDHARARDAVHLPFDTALIRTGLEALHWPALTLHSAAPDRRAYLKRPDLGRRLDDDSRAKLGSLHSAGAHLAAASSHDIAFVVADGLSALAVHRHALPLLAAMQRLVCAPTWRVAPVAVVQQARVAIGDEIGEALGADLVVVLIGERPGLSSPDSLGLYMSWAPRVGLNDAERNCISNVRPEGLAISDAAAQLHRLLCEARRLRLTGVGLKDDSASLPGAPDAAQTNFLLDGPRFVPGAAKESAPCSDPPTGPG